MLVISLSLHKTRDTPSRVNKKKDCVRKAAEPHWVGSSVRRPGKTPSP